MFKRRHELPTPLNACGRRRLEGLTEDLLEQGRLVFCTYGQRVGRYVDVPDGPFAAGEGIIESGSTSEKNF